MPKRPRKDDPTYLLRLGQEEGEKVAAELIRTNPDGLARGERLTADQYHFLVRQVSDRLRKTNRLPVNKLAGERFGAFEQPFWEVLHSYELV